MSGSRTSRLRILVLRDPGFQLDGQDTTTGAITQLLEEEPSFKVTESAAGYGEAARAAHRGDVDLVVVDEVAGEPAAVVSSPLMTSARSSSDGAGRTQTPAP